MNQRTLLLVVIFILSMVLAACAQTSMTVKTYIATSSASSDTTTITERAKYQGFGTSTMKQVDLSSPTATITVTLTQDPTETVVARRLLETTLASTSVEKGVLYEYWDPTKVQLVFKYKDATGTDYISTPQAIGDDYLPDVGALQFKAIATPAIGTGVMFLDASDGHLKISLNGTTWTILSD